MAGFFGSGRGAGSEEGKEGVEEVKGIHGEVQVEVMLFPFLKAESRNLPHGGVSAAEASAEAAASAAATVATPACEATTDVAASVAEGNSAGVTADAPEGVSQVAGALETATDAPAAAQPAAQPAGTAQADQPSAEAANPDARCPPTASSAEGLAEARRLLEALPAPWLPLLPPPGVLTVRLLRGAALALPVGWGRPQPFVEVRLGSGSPRTSRAGSGTSPRWDQAFEFCGVDLAASCRRLHVLVFAGPDEGLGAAAAKVRRTCGHPRTRV